MTLSKPNQKPGIKRADLIQLRAGLIAAIEYRVWQEHEQAPADEKQTHEAIEKKKEDLIVEMNIAINKLLGVHGEQIKQQEWHELAEILRILYAKVLSETGSGTNKTARLKVTKAAIIETARDSLKKFANEHELAKKIKLSREIVSNLRNYKILLILMDQMLKHPGKYLTMKQIAKIYDCPKDFLSQKMPHFARFCSRKNGQYHLQVIQNPTSNEKSWRLVPRFDPEQEA